MKFDVIAGRRGFNKSVMVGKAVPQEKLGEFLAGLMVTDSRGDSENGVKYGDHWDMGKEVSVDVHVHPTFWGAVVEDLQHGEWS